MWSLRLKLRLPVLPSGMHAHRLCGVLLCIRQEHLAAGTAKEHTANKMARGTLLIGADNPNATVSEEQVRAIWSERDSMTTASLAAKHKVSYIIAWQITNSRTWTHVTGATKYQDPSAVRAHGGAGLVDEFKEAQQYIRKNVRVEPDTGCWTWTLSISPTGYGKANFGNKEYASHRLSWMAFNEQNEIGEGLRMRHSLACGDNTACSNPEHLCTGTDVDNAQDRIRAGNQLMGEDHHFAKISAELAMKIKASKGESTQAERANKFGVKIGTVSTIDLGLTWKHLIVPGDLGDQTPSRYSMGEHHPHAKLTAEQAMQIKMSKGQGTQAERALRFGVTSSCVGHIDMGRNWKHLVVSVADASVKA